MADTICVLYLQFNLFFKTTIYLFDTLVNLNNILFYRRPTDGGRVVQWCLFGWRKVRTRETRAGGRGERPPSTRRGGTRDTWSVWATWTGGAAVASWAAGSVPLPQVQVGPLYASSHAFRSASSSSNTAPTSCRRTALPHTLHSTPASPPSYASVSKKIFEKIEN